MQDVGLNLPVGSIIQDRYIVEELLGKGGFGAVYRVRDSRVKGNMFALKEIIDTDKKERQRFEFEGEILKQLDHHALPRVYRAFEDDKNNRAYMLMDYIDGPNLEVLRLQQPEKRFSLARAIEVMAPIVDAVSYLHRQQPPIIHRDIKPANIIVPDDYGEAVLVDFGIAKEYDMDATTTAIRRCSPGYGAPEQYASGTNPGTDIYELGATFYALLTGMVPNDALHRMTQLGSKHADPLEPVDALVPGIPRYVSEAIQRSLAINSRDRFATVDEFWAALNAYSVEATPTLGAIPRQQHIPDPITPAPETVPTVLINRQSGQVPGRRRGAIALLFVAIVLFALMGGVIFGNGFFSTGSSVRHATPVATAKRTRPTQQVGVATPTVAPQQTTTPPAATTTPPAATATSGVKSTATASKYPTLIGDYHGSLTNQANNPSVTSDMMLQNVKQSDAHISGYLAVGAELNGSGNFQGTVTTDNKVQFVVDSYQGNLPLSFTGKIGSDGSMSGTYCSSQNGQCNNAGGGYGTWKVAPGGH